MGLEKIEIENFKSYKGSHTVGPFDKLTCIVGPNGSGKSNIMDAIAFSLGFVSSTLRTQTASNLINSGSSQASVKLFIDQQTFKRHITSSGKSTYFCNGKLISFEDYKIELTKIGLDLKLKNFMVFQGDIHEMANKTPKELCEYFEILSGSIRFKKDYDEISSKLNKDLAECAIRYERKKNILGILKEEKEGEKQLATFHSLLKEKSKLEKDCLNYEFVNLTNKLKTANANLETLQKQQLEKNKNLRDFEEIVLGKKEEIKRIKNELSNLEQEYQNIRLKKMNQVGQMASIYKAKDRNNIRKREIQILEEENKSKIKELNLNLEDEKNNLKKLIEGNKTLIKLREENLNRYKFTSEQQEEYLRSTKEYREELNLLKINAIKYSKDEHKRKENAKIKKKIELLKKNVENLNKNIEEIKIKMGKELEIYKSLEEEENNLNNKIQSVIGNLLKIRASRKINTKKELIRSVVQTLKGIFPGVEGLLMDLVKPVQKKFYSSILRIIGSFESAVVVDSDSTALACINYIKEKKLCRITFLPLDTLKKKEYEIYNEYNFRSAILCVNYNEKVSNAIKWVIKDSIIADTKEVAYDLVYTKLFKANVCSLDNLYIKSKGRLISTFVEVQEDDNLFQVLVEERKNLLKELKVVQDKKSNKVEIVKERLKVYEDKVKVDEEEIKRLGDKYKLEGDGGLVDKGVDIGLVEGPSYGPEGPNGKLEKHLNLLLKEKEREIFGNLFENSKAFPSFEDFLENLREDKTLEFENLKNKLEIKIKLIEEEIKDLNLLQEDLEKEMVLLKVEIKEINPEIETELRKHDFLIEKKKISLENELRDFEIVNSKFKEAVKEENSVNSNLIALESLKGRLEEEIENKKREALMEEIEIYEVRDINEGNIGTVSIGEDLLHPLKEQLALINLKINEIIPTIKTNKKDVDYNKILKEYDDAKEKVVETRKNLSEIKKERFNLFMNCFSKVSEEIGKIYQEISNSENNKGNAYLVLDNPSEPYLEGVRYHVMPPSKRFREIGFLSGGEKSMAILALMFAINLYKPVPFFVLDEFDSALDKTNVGRMVDFFVRCNVQFLVISLKPLLFQYSDSLVGVYKSDCNSKILTYRL